MRRYILTLLAVFVSLTMMAGEVSEQKALEIAQKFMKGKTFQQKSLRRAPSIGDNQFYVFNADGQGGFVIVSADDRTIPVLGYADKGNLEMDKLPENVRYWLDGYAQEIKALGADVQTNMKSRRAIGAPIAPLVTSHWDQSEPFNLQCPMDGDERCVTGCVATAMAQIMYYHKYPKYTVPAMKAYATYSKEIAVPSLPSTTFKWSVMRDDYDYTDTDAGANAVAELMRYCGQAVQMDYTAWSSGASVLATDMIQTFGYSKTAKGILRRNYSLKEWELLMYNELKNKRPVLYSGHSDSGGHEFIIDGYDDKGFFHVNWGWSGASDGFFSLSVLNPGGRGIGGGTSSNGFSMYQEALIGLQAPTTTENYSIIDRVYFFSDYDEAHEFTRTSASADFTGVNVVGSIFYFDGDDDITIDHAWALCKNSEVITILDVQKNLSLKVGGKLKEVDATLTIGKDIAKGSYELREMYRPAGTENWMMCESYYDDILLAQITDTKLTLMLSSEVENAIVVNDVTLTGAKKVGRPMQAHINWTNNGFDNENTFYVWIKNEKESVGASSSYLAHGETGELEIAFTPTKSSFVTVYITNGYDYDDKTDEYNYKDYILWESSPFMVATPKEQKLAISYNIAGLNGDGVLDSKTFKGTATIENKGTNTYDDEVVFQLWIPVDGYLVGEPVEVVRQVKLKAGEKTTVDIEFSGLETEVNYYLQVYYFSTNNEPTGYMWFTVDPSAPSYVPGDANGDGKVNVTDIVEMVNYILGKPSANFNKAAADVNGDGEVNVTDIVSVVSVILASDASAAELNIDD